MTPLFIEKTDPKAFILVADRHQSSFNPETDFAWSLVSNPSDNYPFHLYTTYRLQAKSMRFFPNVFLEDQDRWQPSNLFQGPIITRLSPSYLCLEFRPTRDLIVEFDCYMPRDVILVGSITTENISDEPVSLTLELAMNLKPMSTGVPIRPETFGINQILTGQTGRFAPVLYLTGGPAAISNPYPALQLPFVLEANQKRTLTWSLVSQETPQVSFETARITTATSWRSSAQCSLMKHRKDTIHIRTGDPDWDAAFDLTQFIAMTHCVKPHDDHGDPIFIRTRLPDQAVQPSGSQESLDDLTTLEAFQLFEVLMPARADTLVNIIKRYLNRIDEQGYLYARRDASAFIPPYRESPVLARLCLALYEIQGNQTFLREALPSLRRYLHSWLPSEPEDIETHCFAWENPEQLQMHTGLFLFDDWEPTGRGLDIWHVESPALAAMLLGEIQAMQTMAASLKEDLQYDWLDVTETTLRQKLESFWQETFKEFSYLDCDSHLVPTRELYYPGPVQKHLDIRKHFSTPQRLQCHITSENENTRVCEVQLHGQDALGKHISETFKPAEVRWVSRRAHLTSRHLYKDLDSISIKGLSPKDHLLIETADLTQRDITCLLPLFSGDSNKTRLQTLLDTRLNWKDPGLQHGIPETWQCRYDLPDELTVSVNVLWNTQIIKGLLSAGSQKAAYQLFSNLMAAVIAGLKQYAGFFPFYDHCNGSPSGKRNAIAGLVPLQLFLSIAGIRLLAPDRLAIWGSSPFPWPVEVSWQGLTIRREGSQSQVTFSNGETYQVDSEEPILLTMEKSDNPV